MKTWYTVSAPPAPAFPALEGEVECDVCVIGGGYAGLSAALHLAERDFKVVLLEASEIGSGASGCNGGQVISGYMPEMFELSDRLGPVEARRLWALAEEAKQLVHDRIRRHAIACDWQPGTLFSATKPSHLRWWERVGRDWHATYGYGLARMLDRDEARAMAASPLILGGLYDSGGGHLQPLTFARGLGEAAAAAKVEIFEHSAVTSLDFAQPAATTAGGRVRAKLLVLCANAGLTPLVPELARQVMPVATHMGATEPLGEERARALIPSGAAVCDGRVHTDYYRLSSDFRLLFGTGGSMTRLSSRDARVCVRRRLAKAFPQLGRVRIEYAWSGVMSMTADRMPTLGRLAEGRVLYADGFCGQGIALACLAGRLVAEAAGGFPDRFDIFARLQHPRVPAGWPGRTAAGLYLAWQRLTDA